MSKLIETFNENVFHNAKYYKYAKNDSNTTDAL